MKQNKQQDRPIRIEDLLVWADNLDSELIHTQYDPQTYETPKQFKFRDGPTLQSKTLSGQRQQIETDTEFIQSVEEICWMKYGLRRKKDPLTDEECQHIHEGATKYREKVTMNKTELMCSSLLPYQYFTYDNTFFFFFMKILFINGLIMTIGYTIPAMYRYGLGNRYLSNKLFGCQSAYCQFMDQYSMYNEEDPGSTFTILEWIGLGMVVIMQIVFYIGWKINKEIREVVRYEERCSQCSMLIKGLPEGEFNEKDILNFIQRKWLNESDPEGQQFRKKENPNTQYQLQKFTLENGKSKTNFLQNQSSTVKLSRIENEGGNHFKIRSIQIIYDLREAKEMIKTIAELSKDLWEVIEKIKVGDSEVTIVLNQHEYKKKKEEILSLFKQLQHWRREFVEDDLLRRKSALSSVLLHFNSREDRDVLLKFLQKHYPTEWIISWGNFQPSQKIDQKNQIENSVSAIDNYKLKVGLAPEPENILWEKVEHPYDEWQGQHGKCRFIMVLVPLVHVALIIGLQILKAYVIQTESTANSILGIVISIAIVGANQLLWVFLEIAVSGQEQRLLTAYQVYKNYAGFAGTALSIIVAPLVVDYWWKGNYFGSKAVAGTAFQYQVSSLITIPFMMIIQPPEIIKILVLKCQCFRNFIIRLKYKSEEGSRMKEIYEYYATEQFDISVTYAFLMSNFLHVTFFCMLVPFIIPLYTAQILIFYWACKIRILKFCRFPKLIRRWLMGLVFANLMVSPLFFAAGCLISEHAYDQKVFDVSHTPIALYLFFAWSAIFAVIALFVDKRLEGTQIFKCIQLVDDFTNLQGLQASRNIVYPSRSTSYFIKNNVLSLFGFEKGIMGTVRNKKAEEMLELFCSKEVSENPEEIKRKLKGLL